MRLESCSRWECFHWKSTFRTVPHHMASEVMENSTTKYCGGHLCFFALKMTHTHTKKNTMSTVIKIFMPKSNIYAFELHMKLTPICILKLFLANQYIFVRSFNMTYLHLFSFIYHIFKMHLLKWIKICINLFIV